MCLSVYIYVCVWCRWIRLCMSIYWHIVVCASVCLFVHVLLFVYICVVFGVCLCLSVYMYVYICLCVHVFVLYVCVCPVPCVCVCFCLCTCVQGECAYVSACVMDRWIYLHLSLVSKLVMPNSPFLPIIVGCHGSVSWIWWQKLIDDWVSWIASGVPFFPPVSLPS